MCEFLPGHWVRVRRDYERVGRDSMSGMLGLVLTGCLHNDHTRDVCPGTSSNLLVGCYFPGWHGGHAHLMQNMPCSPVADADLEFRSCWLLPCSHLESVADRPPQHQLAAYYIDGVYANSR